MKIILAFLALFALLAVWLRVLNPAQRQAVWANLRPLLIPAIVAGAAVFSMLAISILNGGITLL